MENKIEVLMVSSPNRDDLVFPKARILYFLIFMLFWHEMVKFLTIHVFTWQGGWEDDENVLEAACREALEEAGVKGILKVGSFPTR